MVTFSVVMPVFHVEAFVVDAIQSVLNQTYTNFELLIIDDCGTDGSIELCKTFDDKRIKILHHKKNKGLAAARNTGIRAANGRYVAFLDADDLWHPSKLALHFKHLEENLHVGLSFSRSEFIEADGRPANCYQMPRLKCIRPHHVFLRNPIGNGSAPVLRIQTLKDIRHRRPMTTNLEYNYFDEDLRRSEDIECWLRVALQTGWSIEGIPQPLTYYRLNAGGLSASLDKQFESWNTVFKKLKQYNPRFASRHGEQAKAYQLRYLSRQAIRLRLGAPAMSFWFKAVKADTSILFHEPGRSFATFVSASFLFIAPTLFSKMEHFGMKVWGKFQHAKIQREL